MGDIFIPPAGGIAFLKVGKLAAKNFPNVQRAFVRLDEFVHGPLEMALKPAERIEISEPISTKYYFPLTEHVGKTNARITNFKKSHAYNYQIKALISMESPIISDLSFLLKKMAQFPLSLLKKMEDTLSNLPGKKSRKC